MRTHRAADDGYPWSSSRPTCAHAYLLPVLEEILWARLDELGFPRVRVLDHIELWSRRTLTRLLEDAGLEILDFRYAGRIRPLAKSMLAVARRPEPGSKTGDRAGRSHP